MILGIGTDIIEIARIKKVLQRYECRFLERVFTPYEREYCMRRKNSAIHLAGRFAAKEAVAKALGTGLTGMNWLDIEIRNDELGKPVVVCSHLRRGSLSLSISHCQEYATAFAVWQNI